MRPMTIWHLALFGLAAGVALLAADTTTVSGKVRVERTKVSTEGPKSFKEVVVYLEPQTNRSYPPPQTRLEMDQLGLVFIPHVMSVQTGRRVAFLNSDNDRHNVYFLFEKTGKTLDIGTWGPGQTVEYTFTEPGEVITLCQLHLEMAAYILVFDHPFHTVAEIQADTQTATFQIKDVPPGEYRLRVWHKKLKQKPAVTPLSVRGDQPVIADLVITRSEYAK